jgi:regulatory protein
MDLAFRLLARRARSESEIREALAARGAGRGLVREVVARLKSLGYVDDRKLVADAAERLRARGFGELRIRDELLRRGVDEKLVDGLSADRGEERERARGCLRARFGDRDLAGRDLAKAARFLAARGFTEEVVASLFPGWD